MRKNFNLINYKHVFLLITQLPVVAFSITNPIITSFFLFQFVLLVIAYLYSNV